MLSDAIVPIVVSLTSLLAYFAGRKTPGFTQTSFKTAVSRLFETIGAFVLFLALNVVLGTTLLLLARAAGVNFVSLYELRDVTLVLLSAVQGLLFRFWWQAQ